jgi:hypothetical protein
VTWGVDDWEAKNAAQTVDTNITLLVPESPSRTWKLHSDEYFPAPFAAKGLRASHSSWDFQMIDVYNDQMVTAPPSPFTFCCRSQNGLSRVPRLGA